MRIYIPHQQRKPVRARMWLEVNWCTNRQSIMGMMPDASGTLVKTAITAPVVASPLLEGLREFLAQVWESVKLLLGLS